MRKNFDCSIRSQQCERELSVEEEDLYGSGLQRVGESGGRSSLQI